MWATCPVGDRAGHPVGGRGVPVGSIFFARNADACRGDRPVRTRRTLWTRLASAAVLAACVVGGSASGQSNTAPTPKYYPGTITPNPTQGAAYSPTNPPPVRGAAPIPGGPPAAVPTAPPAPAPGGAPKPKLFDTPPAGGVRPASATTEPDLPKLDPPGGPSVTAERTPSLPPLPGGTPERAKPFPTAPDAPGGLTAPAPLMSSVPPAPTASAVGSKQSPAVTVECEMPESVGVGQPLAYTLVVKNTGTSAVANVRVDHDLPTGATLVSSDPPAETGTDGRMNWGLGGMEAGMEKRIKVTVKPAEEGELRGRAAVSFTATVEARTKVTRPKIQVTLTAPETARVGEKVPFVIKLTNTGSGAAANMNLHVRLTDGLTHPAGNVIEGTVANLAAGQSKTLPLEVIAGKAGAQQCSLSVFADTNPAETAKANITLVEPQLVAKQTGPTKCFVKAEPVYQIDLSNPGTTTTDPVTVWTVIPEGFEFVQASDGGAYSAANKAVVWKLNGLAAGSAKPLTVKLRSVAPSDGVVRTLAQSGATEQPASGVTAVAAKGKTLEAKCETAVKAEGVPALRFEVVDVDDPVELNKEAVYEIKVTNQGTGPCTNVVIVAELNEGTTAVGTAGPTNGRSNGTSIVFDQLSQLPVKGEAVYKVRVKGSAAGDTRFRVKLTCDQIKTPVSKEENTRFYKE